MGFLYTNQFLSALIFLRDENETDKKLKEYERRGKTLIFKVKFIFHRIWKGIQSITFLILQKKEQNEPV